METLVVQSQEENIVSAEAQEARAMSFDDVMRRIKPTLDAAPYLYSMLGDVATNVRRIVDLPPAERDKEIEGYLAIMHQIQAHRSNVNTSVKS